MSFFRCDGRLFRAHLLSTLLIVVCCASPAWAQDTGDVDIIEGRLTISAAYGFLATFFQGDDAALANPNWGHGAVFRIGGERCQVVCIGISALGSLMVSPSGMGSVGGGPHVGVRWGELDWGSYLFRFGVAYHWLMTPQPTFNDDQVTFGENRSGHGVGAWLFLGLDLRPRSRTFNPILGLRARYVANVSVDPVEHHISAQGTIGFTFGRRLVFGEAPEIGLELEDPDEGDEQELVEDDDDEDRFDLDEHDERRLREAEEDLRNPSRR